MTIMQATFIEPLAVNFGRLTGEHTSIKLYELPSPVTMAHIAAKHGYQVKTFNQEFPRPKDRGYHTGELYIYDVNDTSGRFSEGADYALAWRILHELAHAQTKEQAEDRFGPVKRGGKLGFGMTVQQAKQALWWEVLAIVRQHEILASELSTHTSRKTLACEMNVTLFDGLARVVTGKFLNPDELGFVPYDTLPDWRMVELLVAEYDREAAAKRNAMAREGLL